MKKVLAFCAVAVVLFSVSAGLSYFVHRMNMQVNNSATKGPNEQPAKGGWPAADGSAADSQGLAVPNPVVRPPYNKFTDSTILIAAQLKVREKKLLAREEALQRREKQLQIIFEDMRKEQATIDAMKKEVNQLISKIEGAVGGLEKDALNVEQQRRNMTEKLQAMKKALVKLDAEEVQSIKKRAVLFEKMDPSKAAQLFRHMADNGKIDTVAKIIAFMNDRQGAKVMDNFNDQVIAAQLLEKILQVRQNLKNAQK